jgi:hypothetical protein
LVDYSGLAPHPELPNAEIYIKEQGILAEYDQVILDPPLIMLNTTGDVAAINIEALKLITDYFHNSMTRSLGDAYPAVEEPGPRVLLIRTAITGIEMIRGIPKAVPLRGSREGYMQEKLRVAAASSFPLVQTALEAEAVDSVTGERVAAFTDRRTGGERPPRNDEAGWSQVAAALDFWAKRLRAALDRSRGE